jgi:hypothetical protein
MGVKAYILIKKTWAYITLHGEGSGPKKIQHPTNPVDRKKFDIDQDQYWKSRIKKEE